jgi:hypothetical protein
MFSEIISFLLRNRGRRKGSREGNDVFWTERESKMGYKYKWEKPKKSEGAFCLHGGPSQTCKGSPGGGFVGRALGN